MLVLRWHRAHQTKYIAEETFQSLVSSKGTIFCTYCTCMYTCMCACLHLIQLMCSGGQISEKVVEQWLKEEKVLAHDIKSSHGAVPVTFTIDI